MLWLESTTSAQEFLVVLALRIQFRTLVTVALLHPAEDVVPCLMAMQNSVSLPAAAAEAMLTQSSGSRAASSHQGPPEEEDPAGSHDRSKPEEEVPQSEMAPESMHVPGDENGSEAPAETQVIQGQSRSEGPPGSPAQAWRSRLRSSLDRLRAFTADLAPSTSQPMQSIAPPPTSHATHQPAVPARSGFLSPCCTSRSVMRYLMSLGQYRGQGRSTFGAWNAHTIEVMQGRACQADGARSYFRQHSRSLPPHLHAHWQPAPPARAPWRAPSQAVLATELGRGRRDAGSPG